MECCAFCNQTIEGCACIKCSQCSSHYHLECVSGEPAPSSNSWRCCRCEARRLAAQNAPLVDTNA